MSSIKSLVATLKDISDSILLGAGLRKTVGEAAERLQKCHAALCRIKETSVHLGAIAEQMLKDAIADDAVAPDRDSKGFYNPAGKEDYEHMHDFLGATAPCVVDKNGVPIKSGQNVLIHQDEGIRSGVVVEPFIDRPTSCQDGHWVDVSINSQGPEGIMSYILEVVQ